MNDPRVAEVLSWIASGSTACEFAASLAIRERVWATFVINDFSSPSAISVLQKLLEDVAEEEIALVLFPTVKSETDVVTLLRWLTRDPNWKCVALPDHPDAPDLLILNLYWLLPKPNQRFATVSMGLGAATASPTLRHAPYTALVMKIGAPAANPRVRPLKKRSKVFGRTPLNLADVGVDYPFTTFSRDWDQTRSAVTAHLSNDPYAAVATQKASYAIRMKHRKTLGL